MNRILKFRYFFPIYKHIIIVCHKLKWYWPILMLSRIFISEVTPQAGTHKKDYAILALRPNRFGNDLQQIADTSNIRIYTLSFNWHCCLIAAFYKKQISFENLFLEDTSGEQKLQEFFDAFLPLLYQKYQIKGVTSAAVHYYTDYLLGKYTHLLGYSYIIMHKECFHASENRQAYWMKVWGRAKAFEASYIIVHNEHVRTTFIKSGIITPEKIKSLGCIRMDSFIQDVYPVNEEVMPKNTPKKAVLFSFPHGVGMVGVSPLWSDEEGFGFIKLFEETHASFAKFAQKNPDIECVVKVKWLKSGWEENIVKCWEKSGINHQSIPNLRITEDDCAHALIKTASIVSSFNSTILLEASLARKRVLIPYMAETQQPEYEEYIHLLKHYDLFSVAKSPEEYLNKLAGMIAEPHMLDAEYKKLCALFAEWISPLQANALHTYCHELETLLGCSNKESFDEQRAT